MVNSSSSSLNDHHTCLELGAHRDEKVKSLLRSATAASASDDLANLDELLIGQPKYTRAITQHTQHMPPFPASFRREAKVKFIMESGYLYIPTTLLVDLNTGQPGKLSIVVS